MALATQTTGLTGTVADVDANNNLHTNAPLVSNTAGFVSCDSENDHGSVTGSRSIKEDYSSDDYRKQVGMSTPLFDWNFNGAAQATGQWKCSFTTMTVTEGSGSILLNANSTATAATGCALSSWAYFKLQGGAELYAVAKVIIATNALEAGQICEFGLFAPTATTAPADGAYFRLTSAGTSCVINYNGTETVIAVTAGAFPSVGGANLTAGTAYEMGINVTTLVTEFWINNVLVATIPTPSGNGVPFSSVALPYSMQQRNSGLVSGAQGQLKVMTVHVEQDDLQLGMPYAHVLSAGGESVYQGTEGGTAGSTANLPNSAGGSGPSPVAINNTTALAVGLGGIAAINPTFTVNNDGIVFSFQVPAGGVSQVPRKFVCTGVQVQGCVTTVLAGGPVSYLWQLAFGHSAVSLATAESASFANATAKAPRKIPIGMDTYAATAAVGVLGSPLPLELDLTQGPVTVNPGEFIAIVARNMGVVTTSGAITVMAALKGYWV